MKRIIFSLLIAFAFYGNAFAQTVGSNSGAGSVTPSGTFTPGDVIVGGPGATQVQDSSVLATSPGYATLPTNLYVHIPTLNPSHTVSAANTGLYVLENSVTGSCTGACYYNYINVANDGVGVSGFNLGAALLVNLGFGTSSATGDRAALIVNTLQTSTTGNITQGASYAAISASCTATANDNGTGVAAGTALGQFQCLNIVAQSFNGATDLYQVSAAEFDMQMKTGSSAYEKIGIAISQLAADAVAGSVVDAALVINNQNGAVGWTNGILFGRPETGAWPFASGGVAITCWSTCGTLASVLDFSNATISSNFLAGPGFSVTGLGALTALGVNVTGSGIPADGMYLSSANIPCLSAATTQVACWSISGGGVGSYLAIGATGTINTGDKLALTLSNNQRIGATFRNNNTGSATSVSVILANSTSNTEASLVLNGGSFSGGHGANALTLTSAGPFYVTGGSTDAIEVNASGVVILPSVATGTPAASLCIDSSNNVIKKTTTGACI